jgi:nucleoid-associated protein YgaU
MVQRWRRQLAGPEGQGPSPTDTHGRPPVDLHSSSQNEGTIGARRSDEPVAGADPPGPTLRPTGIDGEVVTGSWRPRDPSAGNSYTIAAGDTLYGIAVKFYGDPRYASNIEAANPGVNPRALRVGDRLVLPEKTPEARPGETPAPAPQGKVYVVQKNDTLIGISRRIYGDAAMYRKIYEANKDVLASPNAALHIGQKLRLPEP